MSRHPSGEDPRGRLDAEVCHLRQLREHHRTMTVITTDAVAQVDCPECGGTGWWDFGPSASTNGPCVDCKGTGSVWVGLR